MKAKRSNLKRLNTLGDGDLSSKRESRPARLKQWRQKLGYYSIFAAFPAMAVSHAQEAQAKDAKKPDPSVAGRTANFLERLTNTYSNPELLRRQSKFRLPHQKGSFDMLALFAGNDDCPGRAIPGGNYTAAAPYTDSGDTTGANDTVSRAYYINYVYYSYDTLGPDHVYSFTLTGLGPNPRIEVSPTSGTYRPLIYVLRGGSVGACPAGTGNFAYNELVLSGSRGNGSPATLDSAGMRFLPLNVPLHLFVDSAANDANGSGPYTIRIQDVTIAPAARANPIDDTQFFIHQHYLDFLNREPDAGGLAYWTNEIAKCGTDTACVHQRRIDVSAAFFIELEFQDTGSFVYRLYRASYGAQPTYAQFTPDRAQVVGGADIEQRKQQFAESFVQRASFAQEYPLTLSNAEFVNHLFDKAGMTPFTAERQTQIDALNQGRTRAQALRQVIEIQAFKDREYNPAFVLMQYFGYLKRDIDQDGYAFWLNVLNNQLPNNYRGMVCAFLTSTEYQRRFGSDITRNDSNCAP